MKPNDLKFPNTVRILSCVWYFVKRIVGVGCIIAASDYVQMPPAHTFQSGESYYATLAHELTHWTNHPARLNRDFGRKRWSDGGYAMEELVAYIASWLKALKNDKRAIFTAASHAQRAVDHLHGLQPAA